jgi:hypothetical protein
MRRVRAIYWARQLARPAPRVALLGALSLGLTSTVSIVNVAVNALMFGGVSQVVAFFIAAFVGTTLAVQALVLGIVATVGWFAFDAVRKIGMVLAPAQEVAIAQ